MRSLTAPMVLVLSALAPQGFQGGTEFVDFSKQLGDPSASVAIVRLGKLSLGKRERIKEGDTELGGLGQSMQVFGTVFYRVPATAKVEVLHLLHGQAPKPALACELRLAALPTGKQQLRFRTPGRALAEEGSQLLVVLRTDKKGSQVVEAVAPASEAKGVEAEQTFEAVARDLHAVNRRIFELRQAIAAAAKRAEVKDNDGALALLDKALAAKVDLREPSHESWVTMHVGPLERAARAKRDELSPAVKGKDG